MQEASMLAEEICCILDIVKVCMSFRNKGGEQQVALEYWQMLDVETQALEREMK